MRCKWSSVDIQAHQYLFSTGGLYLVLDFLIYLTNRWKTIHLLSEGQIREELEATL